MENNYKFKLAGYILLVFVILSSLFFAYSFSVESYSSINYGNKITYTAQFNINGATYLGNTKLTCEVINNKCLITMPIASREGGKVLGYNTDENAHNALYEVYEQVNLTSDMTFYVISNEEFKLSIFDIELDHLSNSDNSCTVYNQEKSCSVKLPFYNKIGYEVRGYSTNQSSLVGFIYPNNFYELRHDSILYPIYNTLTRGKTIDINKSLIIDKMVIDIETGCTEDIYNTYLNYFKKINLLAPYLSVGSKITFLNDDSFDSVWGINYVGMNYGPNKLRLIDVRCSNYVINNYYATIIHEMAHTWDFYYSNFMKKDISEQSDIINLYNKYKDSVNRPFRDYSYTNIREFVADMIRYYYLKYADPDVEYKDLNYPDDIKITLEKYICIANNGYNDSSC